MIGDRLTATIIADGAATVAELTALAAHECFHVFQAAHVPHWGANEATLLTYPWDDPTNLAMANHEVDLLTHARSTTDAATRLALAGQALNLRRMRFAILPQDGQDYENAVELTEGTARAIEHRVANRLGAQLPEPDAAGGTDVRRRCYRTGRDWCHLLHRLAGPEWPARLEDGPAEPMPVLTGLLTSVIGELGRADNNERTRASELTPPPAPPRLGSASLLTARRGEQGRLSESGGRFENRSGEFDNDAWRAGLTMATEAVAAERARRDVRLDTLRCAGTSSLTVRGATNAPLRLTGFDPMNLTTLPGGTMIHERYVALTIGEMRITVLGQATVTTSAGEHPLFSGIAQAEILIDAQFLAHDRTPSRDALAALGIRIVGPFEVHRTGPRTVEILSGRTSVGIEP